VYNTDKQSLRMLRDRILFGPWVREYWSRHEIGAKKSTPVKTAWVRNTNMKKTDTNVEAGEISIRKIYGTWLLLDLGIS